MKKVIGSNDESVYLSEENIHPIFEEIKSLINLLWKYNKVMKGQVMEKLYYKNYQRN